MGDIILSCFTISDLIYYISIFSKYLVGFFLNIIGSYTGEQVGSFTVPGFDYTFFGFIFLEFQAFTVDWFFAYLEELGGYRLSVELELVDYVDHIVLNSPTVSYDSTFDNLPIILFLFGFILSLFFFFDMSNVAPGLDLFSPPRCCYI